MPAIQPDQTWFTPNKVLVYNLYEPATQKTQMLRELQQSLHAVIYTWLSYLQYYITMPYTSYLATIQRHGAVVPT
jgi:hypothetical protein